MQRNHKGTPWCRYADDGLIHCVTKEQAEALLEQLKVRFEACGLELHPDKTKIVYCKDEKRKGKHSETSFDFLGYRFRARRVKNRKDGRMFVSFTPAVSPSALNLKSNASENEEMELAKSHGSAIRRYSTKV